MTRLREEGVRITKGKGLEEEGEGEGGTRMKGQAGRGKGQGEKGSCSPHTGLVGS